MGQFYEQQKFQKFDYGSVINYQKYGQTSPPEFNLTNIQIPVGLFIGRNDHIADVKDNENVREILPNVARFRIFENEDHLSFSFQRDMIYFKEIIQFMTEYL